MGCLVLVACETTGASAPIASPEAGSVFDVPRASDQGVERASDLGRAVLDAGLDGMAVGRDVQDAGLDGMAVGRDVQDAGLDAGRPRPGLTTRWHIDLEAPVDVTVDADWFDLDLFDNDARVVAALHARGRRVVCYFSAGSGEDWRPDYRSIAAAALGDALDGWPGERWLDVRAASVRAVMQRRLDRAVANGCDGVDPDNVDGFANQTGFPLRSADQLAYNRFLAAEAHARGLVVGLKNDLAQVAALVPDFDFAINEQCFAYNECATLAPFVRAGKPVLQIEYGAVATLAAQVCPAAARLQFFSILPGADRLQGSYRRCSDGRDIR